MRSIFFLFIIITFICGQRLPKLNLDKKNIMVAGISSGAAMANQFQMSYSSIVKGVAIIGGPPYWCSQANVAIATTSCMKSPSLISLSTLYGAVTYAYTTLSIDSPSNLGKSKVWFLKANQDSVVYPGVMDKNIEFYHHYVKTENIKSVVLSAEHAWVTDTWGKNCSYLGQPYINNCGFDAAGDSLKWVFGNLNPRNTSINPVDNIVTFDQSYYTVVAPIGISMGKSGYLYVPKSCYTNQCRLLIFFHGCEMSQASDPNAYDERTGYNYWAETNNIVILFPQIEKTTVNPNGCWDWWGYTGTGFATKLGSQIAAVHNMLNGL
eukprot:TRINITY_DN4141_c0_g1_i1.p1 TRINITY_DN4141_c0_g1~~TRINITY_DN4141_c0_g1_i1.p1  ORF type:complete len:322 (+),score=58.01 TRINITY_DN4141_c0_g1_i1:1-966(+)